MTQDNQTLDAALRYAECGYPVFPCAPNAKRPLTLNGFNDATTDATCIEAWWTNTPNANLAVATAGLLVLDLDGPWLTDQPDKLLDLATAPMAVTPRGGKHFVFRQPAGATLRNTAGKLGDKVDTRADGGYVVVAPSIVDGKRYRWLSELRLDDIPRDVLPEPPGWLLALLDGYQRSEPRAKLPAQGNAIPQGKRNATLASLAGTMRRVGCSQAEIFAALQKVNSDRCEPPLASSEVQTIAGSIARHEPDATAVAAVEGEKREPIYRPVLTRLADVQPEPVQWLWPGRIALGKLTLLAGDPGLGKSFLTLDLATRVSCGQAWPDCSLTTAPLGSVVLLGAEDALGDTVRPRLDAMGADVTRIMAIEAVQGNDRLPVNLQRDLPAVEYAIEQLADCRVVVIDPISAYLGKVDSHNNADIRALLHPLADLADRHKVAILAVTHLNKGAGGSALYRATGSLAFVAAARSAWLVAKDPDRPDRRLFLPVKNNLAGDTWGMAFSIIGGVLQWEPEPINVDANKVLAYEPSALREADDTAQQLREHLANGPVDAVDVTEWAEANGVSKKRLWKAKQSLEVQSRKTGFDGRWQWALPTEEFQESLRI